MGPIAEPRQATKNLPFSCGGAQCAINLWKAGNVAAYKIQKEYEHKEKPITCNRLFTENIPIRTRTENESQNHICAASGSNAASSAHAQNAIVKVNREPNCSQINPDGIEPTR